MKRRKNHTGNKYNRIIRSCFGGPAEVVVDVYCVLKAFAVICPALQHCIKKLLCAGLRGKCTRVQDLVEARDALDRAIDFAKQEEK